MSRYVDPSKPLSDSDRAYLLSRGYDETVSNWDTRLGRMNDDIVEVPAELVIDEDDEDDYDDESKWTYQDLQQEARDRQLSAGGKREEIVARLRAHDAESA